MYKVLVADDEKWIRKGIAKKTVSSGLAIEEVFEASDGQEAYELAAKVRPDIILTDIKMPYLSGLEFIEKIRELLPTVKVIVISGYADFEYARCALQLKVFKYILKTVDDDLLKKTLKEAIKEIEEEKKKSREFDELKVKLMERTALLQKSFISQLLNGKISDQDYILRKAKNLEMPLEIHSYMNVMVLQLKGNSTRFSYNYLIRQKYKFTENTNYTCYIYENQQGYKALNMLLLSSGAEHLGKTKISLLSKELLKNFPDSIAFIGIGKTVKGYTQVNKAYIQAIDALKNKSLIKNKNLQFIYFEDIHASNAYSTCFTSEDERTLIYSIESGNYADIKKRITMVFKNINTNMQITTKTLTKLYYEIVLLLENLLNKYNLTVSQVLGEDFISLLNTPKEFSPEQLNNLLTLFALKVSEHLSSAKRENAKTLLVTIKKYIDNNYFEDLTLDTISQKFYISKTYFSQLFKKETGKTFINYLTMLRMKHAKQLFKNNNLKVHEVARIVGYSDPLYFGQVFKKHFGFLPSEYASTLAPKHSGQGRKIGG